MKHLLPAFSMLAICLLCFGICCTKTGSGSHSKDLKLLEQHLEKHREYFTTYNLGPVTESRKHSILLGKMLFFDTRLSVNNTKSCASCHNPQTYFSDGYRRSTGALGDNVNRNAPSLLNVLSRKTFNWANPELTTIEAQLAKPLFNTHPVELGMSENETIPASLLEDSKFKSLAAKAFPNTKQPGWTELRHALADFCLTLVSVPGNKTLSETEKKGAALFYSESLSCSKCHSGQLFESAGRFEHNAYTPVSANDQGVYNSTLKPADKGFFRVPSLINIAVTAPYMHDGGLANLPDVLSYYSGKHRTRVLTEEEKQNLIAFLYTLTDTSVQADPYYQAPD